MWCGAGKDGDVRLSDTVAAPPGYGGYTSGRIELRKGGWGTLCRPNDPEIGNDHPALRAKTAFSHAEANILCKQVLFRIV
jgi:hypothetical protein